MEDGLFPSYLSIDEPEELEEERRLCYVGITRAMERLTVTCARRRMVRGETQYNRMSRFVQEIPQKLMETEGRMFEGRREEHDRDDYAGLSQESHSGSYRNTYKQAQQSFRKQPFQSMPLQKGAQQFAVTKEKGLDYTVGDRVHHIKFGDGTVQAIAEGGRDFEVTVEFDTVGVRKMFATFAKLQKL